MFSLFKSDDGWLHKAVEVEGQLHIIEELQVFEEQQPVTNVLISGKLVADQSVNATQEKPLSFQRLDRFSFPPSSPGECVRGLRIGRGTASLLHLSQIHFLLRLHLCQGPALCLERKPVCRRNGTS